jgi:hypothetical protein
MITRPEAAGGIPRRRTGTAGRLDRPTPQAPAARDTLRLRRLRPGIK